MFAMELRRFRRWLMIAAALAAALIADFDSSFAFAQTEAPTAPSAPASCKLGLFVVGLHDLDVRRKLFNADFWLWSLCRDASRAPLTSTEFVNANRTSASLDQSNVRNGLHWTARKIEGTFRHRWDVRNFPFDRHTLRIAIEEGKEDARDFVYEPDLAASGFDPNFTLPGWKIERFRLTPAMHRYDTTFGDPTVTPGQAVNYSRLTAEVTVVRTSRIGFVKMTAAVYVAAVLALLSFLLQVDSVGTFSSRLSFLAGSLFATVVNMRVASSELGSEDGLTLIDDIHITVLLLIVTATVCTLLADFRRRRNEDGDRIRRFDRRNMAWCAALFVAANIVLVAMAIAAERV